MQDEHNESDENTYQCMGNSTVAILAQGTNWAVATSQAFSLPTVYSNCMNKYWLMYTTQTIGWEPLRENMACTENRMSKKQALT